MPFSFIYKQNCSQRKLFEHCKQNTDKDEEQPKKRQTRWTWRKNGGEKKKQTFICQNLRHLYKMNQENDCYSSWKQNATSSCRHGNLALLLMWLGGWVSNEQCCTDEEVFRFICSHSTESHPINVYFGSKFDMACSYRCSLHISGSNIPLRSYVMFSERKSALISTQFPWIVSHVSHCVECW